MSQKLRGINGKDAIKEFIRAGDIERAGKGDRVNIKMPKGVIITIPDRGKLRIGFLKSVIRKAGLRDEEFLGLI
jgi:predicted RNA binding protein YcfA (HicA-like mRNA interferase family)